MVTGRYSTRGVAVRVAVDQRVGEEAARRRARGSRCAGGRRATPRAAGADCDDRLGHVEHVAQLERRDQLGVEASGCGRRCRRRSKRSCSSRSVSRAFGQRRPGAVDAGAVLHRRLHLVADGGDRLAARRACRSKRCSSRRCLVLGLGAGRGRRARRALAAYSAAARPARAPNTRHSGSELEPSRLAPLMLTQATSPAAYRPGERRRAVDVGVDAAHHVVHDRAHRDRLGDRIDASYFRHSSRTNGSLVSIIFSPRWRRSRWTIGAVRPCRWCGPSRLCTNACESRSRGPSSMLRSTGVGVGLAEVVVLQVAVAVLVEQAAALGARRLGDQDAGERAARSGGTGRTPCP